MMWKREALLNCAKLRVLSVSLFWIKAHAGLEGNERADELAKSAALKSRKRPDYDRCPVSYVKSMIRKGTVDEWDRRYRSGTTASNTKLFFPSAVAAYSIVSKMVPSNITTQVLTGHGGFFAYLHRFKCADDPSYFCEPGVDQTVQHILFQCPVFFKQRFELEQELGIRVTETAVIERNKQNSST